MANEKKERTIVRRKKEKVIIKKNEVEGEYRLGYKILFLEEKTKVRRR